MPESILCDYEVPDRNCKLNFMLDTSAFNKLAENRDWIVIAEKSLEHGFHYYKTANQDFELSGNGAKTYDANCIPHTRISGSLRLKIPVFQEIQERLCIKRVSSFAPNMINHWVLDCTYRVLEDQGQGFEKMANEILARINTKESRNERPYQEHYDAMIAESAMYHNCFLVSDDNSLVKIVNKYFPQKAISTSDLIDLIKSTINPS